MSFTQRGQANRILKTWLLYSRTLASEGNIAITIAHIKNVMHFERDVLGLKIPWRLLQPNKKKFLGARVSNHFALPAKHFAHE